MRILLIGGTGQVGHELAPRLQLLGELIAPPRTTLDLSNLAQVQQVMRAVRPALVVNAAAYTAVDRAESEPALTFRINAEAPGVLATEARRLGAAMVHFSTDFVFDGLQRSPYVEDDAAHPVNVYGASKLAGEDAIEAAGIAHLILRTSWVYGRYRNNFMTTMLRLANEEAELQVVSDQHGSPTWSRTIATGTADALAQAACGGAKWWDGNSGVYHLSAQGSTSRHAFAQAILRHAGLERPVRSISSAAFPLAARRPGYSVLNSNKWIARFGAIPSWDRALADCLAA